MSKKIKKKEIRGEKIRMTIKRVVKVKKRKSGG